MKKNQILRIDASQPLHTPAGLLLGKMWYGAFLDAALKPAEFRGVPHNGPVHSLRLILTRNDLKAFLELVKETYGTRKDGVEEFVAAVMAKAKAA